MKHYYLETYIYYNHNTKYTYNNDYNNGYNNSVQLLLTFPLSMCVGGSRTLCICILFMFVIVEHMCLCYVYLCSLSAYLLALGYVIEYVG